MYLLQSLPTGSILPEGFIPNSRKIVDDVVKKVISTYTPKATNHANPESKRNHCHKIVDEWKNFAENIAPATNCAIEYCVTNPLYIPLFEELFGSAKENTNRQNQCHDDEIPSDVLFQDSVQWSRRGKKRSSIHPANLGPTLEVRKKTKVKKGTLTKEISSEGSACSDSDGKGSDTDGSDCESEDEKCCYMPLTQRQKNANEKTLTKYCGKTFKDSEDDDSSCHYSGVVVDVVFEKNSKTLCFSFRNTKMTLRASLEYIVMDYAINECEWLDLEEEPIVDKIVTRTKPQYVGWAVLGDNEIRKRGLFDEPDATQTTGESSKRSLRSKRNI
jgi:hypothetical protein